MIIDVPDEAAEDRLLAHKSSHIDRRCLSVDEKMSLTEGGRSSSRNKILGNRARVPANTWNKKRINVSYCLLMSGHHQPSSTMFGDININIICRLY